MMKPLLFTLAFVCAIQPVFASDYYFSSSAGNDAYSASQAQSPNTPWRTLDKLNALFPSLKPGDAVYLKRGDVFYGAVTVTASGGAGQPIIIGAYGSGEQPVISGLTTLTTWTSMGGNIWACANTSLSAMVNTVLINDAAQEMGRYPNSDAPGSGYLSIESFVDNSSITDSKLPALPNWTGAEVAIRKRMSIIDRNIITNHSGTTLFYTTGSVYIPGEVGFGYFIQNHRSTLDKNGEWYYDPASKILYVYFSNNNPYAYDVEASSVDNLISTFRQSHLVFDNLTLKGANKCGFNLVIGDQYKISNCNVLFSGEDGIRAASVANAVVENSVVRNSMNNGITLLYGNEGSIIRNNYVEGIMPFAGMGQNSDGNGIGIMSWSNDVLVEYNKIINTGFNGISFVGNNVVIKNNFVEGFCINKNDGGGIYTYAGHQTYSNRKVIGNIVLNGRGVTDGMPSYYATSWRAEGILLDDNSMNVEISGNTVANCRSFGIFMTNASNNVVTDNTVYNNEMQLVMGRNAAMVNTVVTNNNITGNVLFSKSPNQLVSSLYDLIGGSLADYGSFDNNYYIQPFSTSPIIANRQLDAHNRPIANIYTLEDWKPRYGKDASSQSSPVQIPAYTVNAITGSNKFPNPTFDQNTNWVYNWAAMGNSVVSWANGPLDGGCFRLSFNSGSGNSNQTAVNAQVGSVMGGRTYRLKFSLKGTGAHNPSMTVYLRQTGAPYSPISDKKYVKIAATRTENELLFSVPESVDDATLLFEINDQSTPFWIDNIELVEANVTLTNPDDHLRFEYNASQGNKTIPLNGTYIDAKGTTYSNSITLAPYTSAVLIKQSANINDCSGGISRDTLVSACGTYSWPRNGQTYTVSGTHTYVTTVNGCPDTLTLKLTINQGVHTDTTVVACNSFTWNRNAQTYNTSQNVDYIFTNAQGCKDTVTLKLTINNGVTTSRDTVVAQLPFSWNGQNITAAGSYTFTTKNLAGCDITVKLNVTMAQNDDKPSNGIIATYPNPFTDEATVVIQSAESGTSTIEVYDISGALVQRLFSGQLQAGQSRSFTLNGQTLSPGVYIVRFTTNSRTVTRKMTLAR